MIDMFQELIDKLESEKQVSMSDLAFDTSKKQGSKVPNKKVRYLSSVILEFFRSLVENQIPQQSTLQNLLIKFIIEQQDYTLFHTLLQYHVLSESLELSRTLI